MRRILSLFLIVAVLGAAAWTLWRWDTHSTQSADPWRAIPSEAAVVIELDDAWDAWSRFTHGSMVWRGWEQHEDAAALARLMDATQRRLEADATLKTDAGGGHVLIAVLRAGASGAAPLAVGACAKPDRAGLLLGLAPAQWPTLAQGQPVRVTDDSIASPLMAAWKQGIWMLASSEQLIEEGMLQLDRGPAITADPLFAEARSTLSTDADARVLVRTERLTALLSGIWDAAALERMAIPQGWLALDARAQAERLLLTGLLVPAAPSAVADGLQQQGTGSWDITRVLPTAAVMVESRHVADGALASGGTEAVESWMLGAVGVAHAASPRRTWFVATAADPERAWAELGAACAKAPCDTLHHRGHRITRTTDAKGHALLLGRSTDLPEQPWWTILGDEAVMSDDAEAVKSSIDTWLDGGGLAEDGRARGQFRRMSSEAGLTWWCDVARGGDRLLADADGQDSLQSRLGLLGSLEAISVQCSPAPKGWLHTTITLYAGDGPAAPRVSTSDDLLWTCEVGAAITGGPFIATNHTNGMREVLVQDSLHRIHLISPTGKVLWSRALDGPLLGAPQQVDRFKNGKLQLLMATASTMHLIDRNGRDVGLPKALPAAASASLAVFDYEGQREYRVLAPLSDGRLLNLDLDGEPVQGWSVPRMEPAAAAAVQHLRVGGKDFLLVVLSDGAVKLLDRRGSERERSSARLEGLRALVGVEAGQGLMSTVLRWVDNDGRQRATTLGGEEKEASETEVATNGTVTADINLDGRAERVRAEGGRVTATKAGE